MLEGTLTVLVEGETQVLEHGELVRVGLDGEPFASWADEEGVARQELPLPADLAGGERAR